MNEELQVRQSEFDYNETRAWDDAVKAGLVARGVPVRVDVSAWRRDLEA